MNKEPWPEDRRVELDRLIRLINECQSINNANKVIQRLERIEMLAGQISEADFHKPRASFVQFLIDQATGNP
jgi:hypothetical protein